MKFAWIDEGSLSGPVTGLNRGATAGENEGSIPPQELVWGMDNDMYRVVNNVFTPLTSVERDAVLADRQAEDEAQAQALADLEARVAALEAEIGGDGLNNVTPEQVDTYLDNQFDPTAFDNAANAAELKVAIRDLFIANKQVIRKIAMRVLKLSELQKRK